MSKTLGFKDKWIGQPEFVTKTKKNYVKEKV